MALSVITSHTQGCTSSSTPAVAASTPDSAPTPALVSTARATDPYQLARESLAVHGSIDGHAPLTLTFDGERLDLGHYSKPNELLAYTHRLTAWFGFNGELRAVGQLSRGAHVYTGHIELDGTDLYWLDYGESSPRASDERVRTQLRYRLAALVPSLLLSLALAEAGGLSHRGQCDVAGRSAEVVTFTDSAGVPRTLYIDASSRRLLQVSHVEADALFGDDVQTTRYLELREIAGLLVPVALRHTRLWFVEDELRGDVSDQPPSPVLLRAPPPPSRSPAAHVTAISPQLFELRLEHLDNRTLFLELDDHVIAFEAPLSSATGELILAAIERTTGGKPVRKLFISHHHPDYVGGVRPFVARGVTLVTTPGNVHYLERIASAPRLLEPDAQSREQRPALVEAVHGRQTYALGAQVLEVYDIGRHTQHTEEYLVYYFPRQRLLFEGDLLSPIVSEDLLPARSHAVGLATAIDQLGLDVDLIYESWPLHERVPFLPMATLRRMVALRRQLDHQSPAR
jgi:glyoxylase-like metal-dependent hydrolase (beta-lactamase superfamily II)